MQEVVDSPFHTLPPPEVPADALNLLEEARAAADSQSGALPESLQEPSYRNYREEQRGRQVPFHSGSTLKYQRIPMCGHSFVPGREPRHRNCEACWFTFFNAHGELAQSCDEVFAKLGEPALKQLRGPKFAKNFLKFMSTIAQWKAASDAAKVELPAAAVEPVADHTGDSHLGQVVADSETVV